MGQTDEFCEYPGDLEGCTASLTEAFMTDILNKHCIWTGLANYHPQCSETVILGLLSCPPRQHGSNDDRWAAGKLPPDLGAAQAVIHLGYQADLPAVKDIFLTAYGDAIRARLTRLPYADADDTFQAVYQAMETRLRNPKPFRGALVAYLGVVTTNAIRRRRGKKPSDENAGSLDTQTVDVPDQGSRGAGPLSISAVELWEDMDKALAASPKFGLGDRAIFAQGFVCSGEHCKRIPTKELLALWKRLAQSDLSEAQSVASEASVRLGQARGTSVAWVAADMLREDRIESWQLPIVLGHDAGMQPQEVLRLFGELADKDVGYVDQHVPKIQRFLVERLRSQ